MIFAFIGMIIGLLLLFNAIDILVLFMYILMFLCSFIFTGLLIVIIVACVNYFNRRR